MALPRRNYNVKSLMLAETGKGAVIGLECIFAGHTFVGEKLALMKVRFGKNCTIGAYSPLTVGATVENNAVLGRGYTLYPPRESAR